MNIIGKRAGSGFILSEEEIKQELPTKAKFTLVNKPLSIWNDLTPENFKQVCESLKKLKEKLDK